MYGKNTTSKEFVDAADTKNTDVGGAPSTLVPSCSPTVGSLGHYDRASSRSVDQHTCPERSFPTLSSLMDAIEDVPIGAHALLYWNTEVYTNLSMYYRKGRWELFCWSNVRQPCDMSDIEVFSSRDDALIRYTALRQALLDSGAIEMLNR